MSRREQTRRRSGGALFALLRRPAATWLAALTLLVQIGFGAAAYALPEQRADIALRAAIGRDVSLCGQNKHSSAPDRSCPCCDDCALCGIACCGPAGPALERMVSLLAPQRDSPARCDPYVEAVARPLVLVSSARPRGPPVSA